MPPYHRVTRRRRRRAGLLGQEQAGADLSLGEA